MKPSISFFLLLSIVATALVGCATVIGGADQWVTVKTECRRQALQRRCNVSNDKGVWSFETPSRLLIPRSSSPLLFTCQGGLVDGGFAQVSAQPSLETFGNLVLGGLVGIVVDIGNESAYAYPTEINIELPICKFL